MSPLSQTRLLLPLLKTIRDLLGPGEHAAFSATTYGSPRIVARTERGSMIASIDNDGRCVFAAGGGLYTCDPNSTKRDDIYDMVRQALNDAREEWA